jgi:hypothetical protein
VTSVSQASRVVVDDEDETLLQHRIDAVRVPDADALTRLHIEVLDLEGVGVGVGVLDFAGDGVGVGVGVDVDDDAKMLDFATLDTDAADNEGILAEEAEGVLDLATLDDAGLEAFGDVLALEDDVVFTREREGVLDFAALDGVLELRLLGLGLEDDFGSALSVGIVREVERIVGNAELCFVAGGDDVELDFAALSDGLDFTAIEANTREVVLGFEADESVDAGTLLAVELNFNVGLGLETAVEAGDAVLTIAANKIFDGPDILVVLVDLLLVFDHVRTARDVVVTELLDDVEHEVFKLDEILL